MRRAGVKFDVIKAQLMKDEEFKAAYEKLKPQYEVISKIIFPVIFTQTDDGVLVEVPDLEILTEGVDMADAIELARDATGLKGICIQDDNQEIPAPSTLNQIDAATGTFAADGESIVSLVDVDFADYRRRLDNPIPEPSLVKNDMKGEFDMATVNVTIPMDEELKKQAEDLFSSLGLTMESAIVAFATKVVKEQRIPFALDLNDLNVPNAETISAIEEIDEMKRNPERYKGYDNVDEMMTSELEDEFDLKAIAEYEADPDKKTYSMEEVKNILGID